MSDKRHGGLSMRFRAEYDALRDAVCRCHREGHKSFMYYGARGIAVCDRWRFGDGESTGFELFLKDIGPRPQAGLTLDRIDNDRGYEPGNVRWATWATQRRNQRSSSSGTHGPAPTLFVEIDGDKRSLGNWCRHFGVKYHTAVKRLKRGWEPQRAVSEPARAA